MSFQLRKLVKRLVSWSGIFFFLLAAFMLYKQLGKYDWTDIQAALFAIPKKNLLLACLASIAGYLALSSYDYLALRYVKRSISTWKWMFAGIIGFSVSNNAGHAVVSGGTIRYRLYTRWRFRGGEIVKMVTFSGFTYLMACFALIIMGYFLTPDRAFGDGSISHHATGIIALCSAIGLALYFGASLLHKKSITIRGLQFDIPTPSMALAQVVIGGIDILLASLVLYFSITPFIDIPFDTFIGVFIIAQVLGVFSQVPGGLGVFEGLFMYIIPGDHNSAALFGALIAYRIIYYLLPLVFSAVALTSYEMYLKYVRHQTLSKLKILDTDTIAEKLSHPDDKNDKEDKTKKSGEKTTKRQSSKKSTTKKPTKPKLKK